MTSESNSVGGEKKSILIPRSNSSVAACFSCVFFLDTIFSCELRGAIFFILNIKTYGPISRKLTCFNVSDWKCFTTGKEPISRLLDVSYLKRR